MGPHHAVSKLANCLLLDPGLLDGCQAVGWLVCWGVWSRAMDESSMSRMSLDDNGGGESCDACPATHCVPLWIDPFHPSFILLNVREVWRMCGRGGLPPPRQLV